MSEFPSPLMAFQVAETIPSIDRPGHYDADAQVWVGESVGAQTSVGYTTASTTTMSYVETVVVGDSDSESDTRED